MPKETELPRASYRTFCSIIKSFIAAKAHETSVSVKRIASYAGRHPTIISQNIAAMAFLGIVTKEKGSTYKLTKDGVDLAYSIDYNDEEGTSAAFRSIVLKNDFLRSLVFSVKNRGTISNYELRAEIAKRAKIISRDRRATTGAQTVIDILVTSGLLEKEGDNIVPTERVAELSREETADLPLKFEVKHKKRMDFPSIAIEPEIATEIPMQIQIRLDFHVPIHPKQSEVDSIIDTIQKIRDSLRKSKEKRNDISRS